MIQKIRKSIRLKLIVAFFCVNILIVSIIGIINFVETSKMLKNDVNKLSEQILNQAVLSLENTYKQYKLDFDLIASSQEFNEFELIAPNHHSKALSLYNKIEENYINYIISRNQELLSVSIVTPHFERYFSYPTAEVESLNKDYSLAKDHTIHNLSSNIYFYIHESNDYVGPGSKQKPITVLSIIQKRGISQELILKLDYSLDSQLNILSHINISEDGVALVTDSHGKIKLHPDLSYLNNIIDEEIINHWKAIDKGVLFLKESDEIIVYRTIPSMDWKILLTMPYKDFFNNIYEIKNLTIVVTVFGLMGAFIIVFLLTASINKRIQRLKQIMNFAKIGEVNVKAVNTVGDEIDSLASSFRSMMKRLQRSTEQLTEMNNLQNQTAIAALQSQINSHFLYNALESINSIAHLNDQKDIETIAISLSKMFRYTSNYKDILVPLEGEIQHVEHYLSIIQIRYGSAVTYSLDLDDRCKKIYCLKAVLQPIVENCIKHGIEVTGEPIHIVIKIEMLSNGMVSVTISDNGPGISEQTLMDLQKLLMQMDLKRNYKHLSKVGLLNVHYRIKMYYSNEQSGIDVMSNLKERGTIIKIIFPFEVEGV